MRALAIFIAVLSALPVTEVEETANSYRFEKVQLDAALCRAAQDHADYMARTGDFAHTGANGSPMGRAKKCGYKGGYVTENISWNTLNPWPHWKNSPSHYKNMTDPNVDIFGYGESVDSTGQAYCVCMYAKKVTQ